ENLCVNPTGHFDSQTREAIRQAKLGAIQRGAPISDTSDDKINHAKELEQFRVSKPCSQDFKGVERGYKTAFEKFRFPFADGITTPRRQLSGCGLIDTKTESFDEPMRAFIKKKAQGQKSSELYYDSYNYISKNCIPS